jgi:carbamoylphosphate synthase large subunit
MKILILGGSRYYIQHIIEAKKTGYYVHVVDRNSSSPGFDYADEYSVIDIVDTENLFYYCKENEIKSVIPLNDYGVISSSIIAEKLGLDNHLSIEVAKKCTSKRRMREIWMRKGVSCPELIYTSNYEECKEAIDKIGYPCILKPAEGLGGGSRGVVVVHSESEEEEAIKFCISSYDEFKVLVEDFVIAESEHSIEVVVEKGNCDILLIGDNVKMPLPYRVNQGIYYPTQLSYSLEVKVKKEVEKAVLALGLYHGVAHVELGIVNNEPVLFEMGARCGGGAIPDPICTNVVGVNEFLTLVNLMTKGHGDYVKENFDVALYYYFVTPRPGKIREICGLDEIVEDRNVLDFAFFKEPGDIINDVKIGPDRSGFAVVKGKSGAEVFSKIRWIDNQLNIFYAN